ncbi:prepilin-type N-terminal cleavage/methylation domain-containing protein [uncultured Pseudacidovorax sp.]|uniref:prepilin-type N-terminal cleavage/methylation domain-containing protein n=1 Tax=uncultured Pseudacidovorax sp. TaxID=679313 RepID=UPI0025E43554|nr:prepilin-type N-terminal cleavage/methylation domain-containing protein [uncultured Pseudacidovorax sp.]
MKSRNSNLAARQGQQGFTLVEMAVVLIVIGVIISAVMIGRDVQRNAEYVRIRQTFVNQWAEAYNAYRQRYGIPVGDSQARPRQMVNGANFMGATSLSGGDMTGVRPPPAVCSNGAGPNMARAAQTGVDLIDLMRQAGIELPPGRGTGMEDRYVYQDSNGNPQEIQICFQWNAPGTPSGSGNVMVITGLTPDLARSLASGLKGNADANSGTFRQEGVSSGTKTTGAQIARDWTVSNIADYSGAEASSYEAQVATVIAHYKMNQ